MSVKLTPGASRPCFLCQTVCDRVCPHCELVTYCSEEHFKLHRLNGNDYCFPYQADNKEGIGRILRATRNIKAMDIVLIDPGTVVGPNYSSKPICLECLRPVGEPVVCLGCRFPMCSEECRNGVRHQKECEILGRCTDWPSALRNENTEDSDSESNAYSVITPLRNLLQMEEDSDNWRRTNQLMDHEETRHEHPEEWDWYQIYIVEFLREQLGLKSRFSEAQIQRAIGLLNVNAVALQFAKGSFTEANQPRGKGLYPIFAIMSHYCICNARYTIHPDTFEMYVRARRTILAGEEISVQYLSALVGNLKRRKKIRSEWYFDCLCKRCSDPTECGTYISAIKCYDCVTGNVLPKDSLDFDSAWTCSKCPFTMSASAVDSLVDAVEDELNSIGKSGKFEDYEGFIAAYSETVLHTNHYLIMTATRNLIQYLTYGMPSEALDKARLKTKLRLCQDFYSVLTKVDPGFSEIRSFVQKELNFCRLLSYQQDFEAGTMGREEYLVKSRQSLAALDEVEKYKKLVQFFTRNN